MCWEPKVPVNSDVPCSAGAASLHQDSSPVLNQQENQGCIFFNFFFLTLHRHQQHLLGQGGDSAAARAEGDGAAPAFACCYWWWICGLDHGPVYLNKGILGDTELAAR